MTHGLNLFEATDIFILTTLVLGGAYWLFRSGKSFIPPLPPKSVTPDPRARSATDTIAKTLDGKFTKDGKDIVILYGSQTGTAEEYAARLAKEGAKYGLQCLALDPEDFEMEDLTNIPRDKLIIFVLATYGEGEPTDNALGLKDYLCNQAQENAHSSPEEAPLKDLHYAIFGLGNKTYEQFNAMARNVDKWCTNLGGVRVGPRGEGDDAENLEESFIDWRTEMWKDVAHFFNIDLEAATAKSLAQGLNQRSYNLTELSTNDIPSFIYRGELGDPKLINYDIKNPFYANIIRSRELFSGKDNERNCVHMEFELTGSKFTYQAGDHLALWPENNPKEIELLTRALNISDKLDQVIMMKAVDPAVRKKYPFPCPTTYRTAFTHYLDIGVSPKSYIIQAWLSYCPKGSQVREYYESLISSKEKFASEVTDCCSTVGDLLTAHPIPDLPLGIIIEGFQRVQQRYYSISSSPRYIGSNTMVHITASVLRYEAAKGGKKVQGLATRHIYAIHQQLEAGASNIKLPISIRRSGFKLPRQNATPIIMIGPGTGVAPMRGFIQDRCATAKRLAESTNNGISNGVSTLGEAILFFGCRNESQDYLYVNEWKQYIEQGGLSEIITAFSRDGPKKVYVQHRLKERSDKLWEMISRQSAHIYVCGDGKNMARDVLQFFVDLAKEKGGMEEEKAVRFVKDMRSKGRYQEDVWV